MELRDINYSKEDYVETVIHVPVHIGQIKYKILLFAGIRKQGMQADNSVWFSKYNSSRQGDCTI